MNNNIVTSGTHKKSAFTRLELVFVAVLLAFGILFFSPFAYEWDQRTRARMYVDNSNLKQICIAFYAYSEDHNGVFPVHPKEALRYIHDPSGTVFFSPFQENRGKLNLGRVDGPMLRYGSYVFVNLGFSLSEVEKPGARIIAYTAKISSDQTRRSVLFADGHAEIWDEDKLRAALPEGVDVDALDGP